MSDTTRHLPIDDTRLGGRVSQPGLALTVMVPAKKSWRHRPPVAVVAPVIDLSVTGARLGLEDASTVATGTHLAVHHKRGRGLVVVRHVQATSHGVHCGVEFVELDDRLRELVYERLAGERAEQDWRWQSNH